MKIAFSNNPVLDYPDVYSVFLMGPTPRSKDVPSWRPEAIGILQEKSFQGTVFVPEWDWSLDKMQPDYDTQIKWETEALEIAGVVMAWVPRDLETMPAFTTNVEFGLMLHSDKLIYGRPDSAPKNRYLDYKYREYYGQEPSNNLEDLIDRVLEALD